MNEEDPLGEIEKPVRTDDLNDIIPEEYGDFIKKIYEDIDDFEAILMASNYLNIKDLLELASAQIAAGMRGKTLDEIRAKWRIVHDFTE